MSNEPKVAEETTAKETSSTPEENNTQDKVEETTQKNETGDEQVTVSAKELETWKKKASDFDGFVEKQRLAKLEKKRDEMENQGGEASQVILDEIKSLKEEIGVYKSERKKTSLSEAYKEFVSEHKWADNDEIFSKISENFKDIGDYDKATVLKELKKAALMSYPENYEKALFEKAKTASTLENEKISTGGNSGGGSEFKEYSGDGNVELKESDRRIFNRMNYRRKAQNKKPLTPKEFNDLINNKL